MIEQHTSLQSLRQGNWFKLICGASFQHLPAIRNLTLAYALAGADCIDVAADPAVVLAAKEALEIVTEVRREQTPQTRLLGHTPLLMVSLSAGEDPHFRKAEFLAEACPKDCSRPCEMVCPANAIDHFGVVTERCYGCGRCLPVCPVQHISTRSYASSLHSIASLILETGIDAIEIHTQPGHLTDFQDLWTAIKPWVHQLKLLAISCPNGEGLIDYLRSLHDLISPLPCPLIWQTDGRPMSGDIGIGTTKAAIQLGQRVLNAQLPGYVQLAGGTNSYTVPKLRSLNLLRPTPFADATATCIQANSDNRYIAGVAYGSYARVLLSPVLEQLETMEQRQLSALSTPQDQMVATESYARQQLKLLPPTHLEDIPELLAKAVSLAHSLVSQIKPFHQVMLPIS